MLASFITPGSSTPTLSPALRPRLSPLVLAAPSGPLPSICRSNIGLCTKSSAVVRPSSMHTASTSASTCSSSSAPAGPSPAGRATSSPIPPGSCIPSPLTTDSLPMETIFDLEQYVKDALAAGCPLDQVQYLTRAGVILLHPQLAASAAARLCDL